jgi:hypothetical protein
MLPPPAQVSIKLVLMRQQVAQQEASTKYLQRQQAVSIMSRSVDPFIIIH